jgi:hypothetical protein
MSFLKKALVALSLTSFLTLNACGVKESTSEVKIEPTTTFAAIQTAIALVQAIYERNNAVSQTDINTILYAIKYAKEELIAHVNDTRVQEWVASVNGLELSFERYPSIRQDKAQLNSFLLSVEASYAQLEAIFRDIPVYQSYHAALAFNSIAAIRMVALMDYSGNIDMVKTFTLRVLATNEKLLSVPAFPAHTINEFGMMSFENCKVFMQPYIMDQRDHIMYSAMAPWTGGYHKNHEFRYYYNGQLNGRCFEDDNGNQARPSVFGLNSWATIAPVMYNQNVQTAVGNASYQAIAKANDAIKTFQGYFVKVGNNGTVSCDTYCGGSQWAGGVGRCISASLSENSNVLSCSTVPGLLAPGAQLLCQCTP